jgi:hypothetical protein
VLLRSCFFQLRRLRQIRRSVGEEVTKCLVTALVLSRLDYCNAALAGLPESAIRPLQRVQNAATRLVTNAKSSDHITPILKRQHWLPVNYRIIYKLCFLMHLIHTNQCPDYMAVRTLITAPYRRLFIAVRPTGLPVILCIASRHEKLGSVSRLSVMPVPPPGTAYNTLYLQSETNTNSLKKKNNNNLKRFCLLVRTD